MTTTLSTGWSKKWSSPIFTVAEAQGCVSTVLVRDARSVSKICDVRFIGSSYPTLAFYTGSPYIAGSGTDHYWAVVTNWRNIILNTSSRMNGRWLELWKTQPERIAVLTGLYMHEAYHIIPRHTMDQSGAWPITPAMEAAFVKRYGKPHKVKDALRDAVEADLHKIIAPSEELDVEPPRWLKLLRVLWPESVVGVVVDDDKTNERLNQFSGVKS